MASSRQERGGVAAASSVRGRAMPRQRPRLVYWHARTYDSVRAGSIDGTDTTPHDKGLVRAAAAKYEPQRDARIRNQGNAYLTVFVGRISFRTKEEAIRREFAAFGAIKSFNLVRDIVTGASRGYAFIEYATEAGFMRAFRDGHGMMLDGARLLVDYQRATVMKGWVPRRLGGGLGGRKESGQLRFGGRDKPFRAPIDPAMLASAPVTATQDKRASAKQQRRHDSPRSHRRRSRDDDGDDQGDRRSSPRSRRHKRPRESDSRRQSQHAEDRSSRRTKRQRDKHDDA